jgi:hypothetical protein
MLDGMSSAQEPPPAAVDALRQQLRALAGPSGLPAPELKVDAPRQQERLPALSRAGTVVVPRSLLAAGRARQLWHLAAALGRLASPVPRQRQRLGWGLFAAACAAYLVLVVLGRQWSWVWLALVLLYPLGSWTARWERRAMEDAGIGILAAAGHDPGQLAREAFGDDPEPTPWKRLLSNEPSPQQRIAVAARSHP